MNIASCEHVFEPLLTRCIEAATGRTHSGVSQGPEKRIPKREIGKIIGMVPILVMNPMRLRPLDDNAEPSRCANIPVIKKFGQRGEKRIDRGSSRVAAEQQINNRAAENGVQNNLDGMLIEARNDLDATGGMMELMAKPPEKFRFVPIAMPPIVNECRDEVSDQSRSDVGVIS